VADGARVILVTLAGWTIVRNAEAFGVYEDRSGYAQRLPEGRGLLTHRRRAAFPERSRNRASWTRGPPRPRPSWIYNSPRGSVCGYPLLR